MARDPGSVWAPLPEAGAPDGHTKTQFIVHSTGDNGTAKATARYFGGSTPNESTFIVGQGPHDPTLQIMDSTDHADANGSANRRGISVEVVGDGVGGYNAWQRSELIRLGRWAKANHPIQARIIPSEPASGFGWHVMFGAPGPWASVAKVCPGKQRIKELQTDIFPAIFAGTDPQEDDMTPDQARELADIHHMLVPKGGYGGPPGDVIAKIGALQAVLGMVAAQAPDIDEEKLAAALAPTLVPAVLAAVAGKNTALTQDDVEAAIREVLGSLGTPA